MKEETSFEDFIKVDVRIWTITDVKQFPKAKKPAYQILIDFGTIGIKKSSAQITELYTKEKLLGKQVIAIINFNPRQIANFISECLILGVYNKDGHVVLLQTSLQIKNGEQIR